MDESIKCECGNDKFWWFGDYLRCPKCHNEYKKDGIEYWLRRFNKEENHYSEHWEHSHSGPVAESWSDHMERQIKEGNITEETFQQISDKGLESLKDAIVGEPSDLDGNWIEQNLDPSIAPPCEDEFNDTPRTTNDFIIENAVDANKVFEMGLKEASKEGDTTARGRAWICISESITNGLWRKFWNDRAKFENWFNEYKKQQHILFLENHIEFLKKWQNGEIER